MKIAEAIEKPDSKILRLALAENPQELLNPGIYGSWMHHAASLGNVDHMEVLLDFGLKVDQVSPWNSARPLNKACNRGNLEAVKWLISKGASLEGCLVSAVSGGSLECLQALLDAGADPTQPSGQPPRTAYQQAIMMGKNEIAEFLSRFVQEPPPDIVGFLTSLFGPIEAHDFVAEAPWRLEVFRSGPSVLICTVGLSSAKPAGLNHRAELGIRIPSEWLGKNALNTTPSWPLEYLMDVSLKAMRDPIAMSLSTIGNGNPPRPLAPGVDYCGMIVVPEHDLPGPRFADGSELRVFTLQPLFAEELQLAQTNVAKLVKRFDSAKFDPKAPWGLTRRNCGA